MRVNLNAAMGVCMALVLALFMGMAAKIVYYGHEFDGQRPYLDSHPIGLRVVGEVRTVKMCMRSTSMETGPYMDCVEQVVPGDRIYEGWI